MENPDGSHADQVNLNDIFHPFPTGMRKGISKVYSTMLFSDESMEKTYIMRKKVSDKMPLGAAYIGCFPLPFSHARAIQWHQANKASAFEEKGVPQSDQLMLDATMYADLSFLFQPLLH